MIKCFEETIFRWGCCREQSSLSSQKATLSADRRDLKEIDA